MMDDLRSDLRLAIRMLGRNPGFTGLVLLLLALGIGANTAIFSLMDQVLVRALPVRAPERLVILDSPGPFSGMSHASSSITPMSFPAYERMRDQGGEVFESVFAHMPVAMHLRSGNATDDVNATLVSGTYFDALGVQPAQGRLIGTADDTTPGAHPVIVLSHAYWSSRFGGDPSVVGRTVGVNGQPMTVIGVAARGFHGVEIGVALDAFVPLTMLKQVVPTWPREISDWRARFLIVMARLREGVTAEAGKARLDVLYRRTLEEDLATIPDAPERFRTQFLARKLELLPGGRGISGLREQSRTPLIVLMGMVGLVLLIACANVANLLLARASARQKEIAVRIALGASRWRLVRQLLAESVIVALVGGLLGLVVAVWTGRLLVRALPIENPTVALSADPDLRMALFAAAVSMATGLAFGLVPALQSTRPQLAPTLKNEGGAVVGGGRTFRFRKGLVVAQIALSLLLLVGAGLFTRSLMNLRSLDPGFDPESLVTFTVDPSLGGLPLPQRLARLQQISQELEAEPGVRSVSMAELPLMANSDASGTVRVEGYEAKEEEDMNPRFNSVAPRFFETLSMPLLAGRDVADTDVLEGAKVAVVNEEFARYFFKSRDVVGRRFGMGRRSKDFDITIVGLVRDGKASSLREEQKRFVYFPYGQRENLGSMTYYVRSTLDPGALAARIRQVVQRVDPALPVTELKTMQAQIRESLFVDRLVAQLSLAFGLLATILAAVGLYGVTSYAVAQRTREIGIRIALGAERRSILGLVLREVSLLASLGVLVGLPSAYALGRAVEAQLFGLDAFDLPSFALAVVVLVATSVLAGYVPATRASRVDPMVALRQA